MPSRRLALAALSHSFRNFTASRFWKIQLYADPVGVVEKELSVAGARYNLLAELDVVRLQPRAHAIDVGCGEGDMIKPAGVFEFLLGAANHDSLARLAGAHQMHRCGATGIEPVTGKIERRPMADLQPEHVDIEALAAFEVLRLDREMLQSAKRHRRSPYFA